VAFDTETCLRDFFQEVARGVIEIYNEFSLQHELGCFLRSRFPHPEYKIQFERPVSFFDLNRSSFVKKEIDVSVFTPDRTVRVAIELKFPRNGQHPEQMFKFCQDVSFVEQLVDAGFDAGIAVLVVEGRLFYQGRNQGGIYSYFRGDTPLRGRIQKPTGAKDDYAELSGTYRVRWREVKAGGLGATVPGGVHYTFVDVRARQS